MIGKRITTRRQQQVKGENDVIVDLGSGGVQTKEKKKKKKKKKKRGKPKTAAAISQKKGRREAKNCRWTVCLTRTKSKTVESFTDLWVRRMGHFRNITAKKKKIPGGKK